MSRRCARRVVRRENGVNLIGATGDICHRSVPGSWFGRRDPILEPGMAALSASVLAGESLVLVELAGSADAAASGQLRDLLAERVSAGVELVVDLSGVDFIDSACAGVLVTVCRDVEEVGGTLAMASPPESAVTRTLRLQGVDQLIGVYDSVAEAVGPDLPPL
jgi:anti-sigma B factor antagonist